MRTTLRSIRWFLSLVCASVMTVSLGVAPALAWGEQPVKPAKHHEKEHEKVIQVIKVVQVVNESEEEESDHFKHPVAAPATSPVAPAAVSPAVAPPAAPLAPVPVAPLPPAISSAPFPLYCHFEPTTSMWEIRHGYPGKSDLMPNSSKLCGVSEAVASSAPVSPPAASVPVTVSSPVAAPVEVAVSAVPPQTPAVEQPAVEEVPTNESDTVSTDVPSALPDTGDPDAQAYCEISTDPQWWQVIGSQICGEQAD